MSELDNDLIEKNEELEPYIGMYSPDVQQDLEDKGIRFRIWIIGNPSRDTMEYNIDRVNIVVDNKDIVVKLYYG